MNLINEICNQIIVDPSTKKIINASDENILKEKFNDIENFVFENSEHEAFINLIIKLQVYDYFLKNNETIIKENSKSKIFLFLKIRWIKIINKIITILKTCMY